LLLSSYQFWLGLVVPMERASGATDGASRTAMDGDE
jgi:hypothetical protein